MSRTVSAGDPRGNLNMELGFLTCPTLLLLSVKVESFHVKCSNLVEVRARTDPDLPNLVIFHVFFKNRNSKNLVRNASILNSF